jgi:hypothetical protein
MSIPVSIPVISELLFLPSVNNTFVADILNAIREEVNVQLQMEGKEVEMSKVSLRSLVSGLQNRAL